MKQPTVMVCPLDWGLGHATRCIPIIRQLIEASARVILASDGPQLHLLRSEFPDLEYILLPGYKVKFSRMIPLTLKMILDVPRIFLKIRKEHEILHQLIEKHKIDMVISDNRYGLWNSAIHSVIITHQLNIIPPAWLRPFEQLLHRRTHKFIEKFTECWIPDAAGEINLSGKLSHGPNTPQNVRFIGILSRFDRDKAETESKDCYKLVAIVSGPEPQRSRFEESLLAQLPVNNLPCLLVRGLPGNTDIRRINELLDVADHLPAEELEHVLHSRPMVICRAGYSTLMDITITGNKAILVPTPGQTEQEYLAKKLSDEGIFYATTQSKLNLKKAVEKAKKANTLVHMNKDESYKAIIRELIAGFSQ